MKLACFLARKERKESIMEITYRKHPLMMILKWKMMRGLV
jgi:hypothetical protein